ncbi:transport and Golgi organization protein 2 homolog [Panulirus ornatus]|uniref:transport and Golgi organization protein 2 homolog n=1 Tax=Panulirus ornatus TaxID=150431 RepID=UPI003A87EC4E
MCLLFVYINPSPKEGEYKIVLVNNRDETYIRPAKPAHMWDCRVIGGMDAEEGKEGGTWLGISEAGKIGCLMNIFQPVEDFQDNVAPRGFIVVNYLQTEESGPDYMENIAKSGVIFNHFNLVTLDPGEESYNASYYNSQINAHQKLESGVHGFGNCQINTPFKKVQKGQRKLKEIIEEYGKLECEEQLISELFTMMQDTTKNFPDKQLIEQGRGHSEEFVKNLSSIYVSCPSHDYGTRTTTAILVDHTDRIVFREKTMQQPITLDALRWEVNTFSFFVRKMDHLFAKKNLGLKNE